MGYRTYLGKISKEEYLKIKDLPFNELSKIYDLESVYDIRAYNFKSFEKLYEFGKYTDFNIDLCDKFFTHIDIDDDDELYLANPEFLISVIKNYQEKSVEYFQRVINGEITISDGVFTAENYLKSKIEDFSSPHPFKNPVNFDLENQEICTSWSREYSVFELARILKQTDYTNEYLIYYGY